MSLFEISNIQHIIIKYFLGIIHDITLFNLIEFFIEVSNNHFDLENL